MSKPTIQDAVDALNELAAQVATLGIEKVADHAGVKPRVVRKFVLDVLVSKNSDIKKITESVRALETR